MTFGSPAALAVAALFLVACTSTAPDPAARSTQPSPTLRLSNDRVPTKPKRPGLAPDARFIKGTGSGSFTADPIFVGGRVFLRLEGEGCRDADSVLASLYRVKPPEREGHVHESGATYLGTTTFVPTRAGWSGRVAIRDHRRSADYSVGVICERGGHAYYPATMDVHVGASSD